MTDRPGRPDPESDLQHVMPSGPGHTIPAIPGPPPLPRESSAAVSTAPPESMPYQDPGKKDPMHHAPRWGRHLHGRVEDVFDRLHAVEVALHDVSAVLDVKTPALRRDLVNDIASAMASHINPILADNAAIKQLLTDIEARLRVAEGKIVDLQLNRKP